MARTLTEADWQEVRRRYEGLSPNITTLSKIYGISRQAIQYRATANSWVKGPVDETGAARDLGPAAAPDPLQEARAAGSAVSLVDDAERKALLTAKHRKAWRFIDDLQRDYRLCLTDPEWKPKVWSKDVEFTINARAKWAELILNGLSNSVAGLVSAQAGEARVHGLDYREATKPMDPAEGARIRENAKAWVENLKAIARRTVPEPKEDRGDDPLVSRFGG